MKKKKIFIILTLILVLMLSGYIIPITIVNNYAKVTLISPYTIDVIQDIHITGEVKEVDVAQVITPLPLVPSNVLVKVGDTVTANQTLATIDKNATVDAIISLANTIISAGVYLPDFTQMLGIFGGYGIDFEYENSLLVSANYSQENLSNQVEEAATKALPIAIKATANGVITSMEMVRGSMTAPQGVVCTISNTDELYVQLQINESNIQEIEVGDKVLFKAIATDDEKYMGTITTIFPTASKVYQGSTQKTVVGAYVELDEVYENLKPGYNITGVVKENESIQAMILPYESVLQDEDDNEYVYIYEEQRAIKQIITTGRELAQGVEVLTGVSESTIVIANPNEVTSAGSVVLLR